MRLPRAVNPSTWRMKVYLFSHSSITSSQAFTTNFISKQGSLLLYSILIAETSTHSGLTSRLSTSLIILCPPSLLTSSSTRLTFIHRPTSPPELELKSFNPAISTTILPNCSSKQLHTPTSPASIQHGGRLQELQGWMVRSELVYPSRAPNTQHH